MAAGTEEHRPPPAPAPSTAAPTRGNEDPLPPAPDLSIVVPAHNEEAYLVGAVTEILAGVRPRAESFEVLICENGSVDRTAGLAAELSELEPEVSWLQLPKPDYGLAQRAGFLAARGEMVVNFDVDFVDLGFLDRAIAVARTGTVTIVVGSKRGAGAEDGRAFGRRAVTGVFSLLLRHGFGLQVSDTHGLKLLRRAPLVPIVEACRSGADIFDTELVLRAERAGLQVEEIPVRVAEQRPPRTPIATRIPRTLRGLVRLRLILWREARSQPAPNHTPRCGPTRDHQHPA